LTRYDRIPLSMKISIFSSNKKAAKRKTIADYKQEALVKQGAQQFKKLLGMGLRVPVALL